MFSRQVFGIIRAATLQPTTPFLRVGPARNFTGAVNDSRPQSTFMALMELMPPP
ncbi:hypothetical protein BFJ70_g17314 [Fusarium oxysporum]|nr:hypothetical protein BFJ70_g17314 [Fusarium oxysporum]